MESGVESPGRFSFGGLPIGDYRLSVVAPPGFATVASRDVSITSDTSGLDIDIGLLRQRDSQLIAGDANQDFFFDEADWILAMKGGKFEKDVTATWREGDFNGDGRFDQQDIKLASQSGAYDPGGVSYAGADTAEHTRLPLSAGANNATVQIFYLQNTGSIAILSDAELSTLHLYSESGLFEESSLDSEFDVRSPQSAFWFDPTGWEAKQGLVLDSQQDLELDYLLSDLSVDGTLVDGSPLESVSLSILVWRRLLQSCFEIRSAGAIAGDANLDGVFNSSDLVRVFQRGEYEDGRPDNSNWHTGDWNCDGEFDSSDIVEAFEQAGFEIESNAAKAVAAVELLTQDAKKDSDDSASEAEHAPAVARSASFESYTLYNGSTFALVDAAFVTVNEKHRREFCRNDCVIQEAFDDLIVEILSNDDSGDM